MNKFNFLLVFLLSVSVLKAQTVPNDSVNSLPNNADMVFYNLATGAKTAVSDTDWHLAISILPTPFPYNPLAGVTIRMNEPLGGGMAAYVAAHNNAGTFTNLDTTNWNSWAKLHDSDFSLEKGALNSNANASNPFDFGWGTYDENTHNVTGDSVFLIKLPDGTYKKLLILDLNYDTAYDIEYANLDNSSLRNIHITKSDYAGKNFVYLNLENDSVLDKEPVSTAWDLLFLKYAASDVPNAPGGYYNVAGVWLNPNVTASKDSGVDVSTNGYHPSNFTTQLNIIGWNWVSYNFSTYHYEPVPSLDYFVKANDGNYYKMIFTGYGSGTTGIFYFNISGARAATAVKDIQNQNIASIFPNPANETLNLLLNSPAESLKLTDINGRVVSETQITDKLVKINTSDLTSGVYIISVIGKDNVSTSKFVVAH